LNDGKFTEGDFHTGHLDNIRKRLDLEQV
jgi:hypothetical protein